VTDFVSSIDIDQLRLRAEHASTNFERDRGDLYRDDGSPLFSEDEHARREGELAAERNRVLSEVTPALEEAITGLRDERANLENADPAASLTDAELSRAASLRGFVADEAGELSVENLVARLNAVRAAGERGSMLAHARAARRRLQSDATRRRRALQQAGQPTYTASPDRDLQLAVEGLEGALGGEERARGVEDVKGRISEAEAAHRFALEARHGAPYKPKYSVPGR
jgi:hypothetical protein